MKNFISFIGSTFIILFLCVFLIKSFDYLLGVFIKKDNNVNRYVILKEHSPLLDDTIKLSSEILNNKKLLEDKKYFIKTNKDGYILGPLEKNHNEDNKPDIIFFGGSTTETLFVDEEARFPYLVSKLLVKQNNDKVFTLNGGVSGNHSLHSLINLIAKGVNQKPNFVVFLHGVVDMGWFMKNQSYWSKENNSKIIQLSNDNLNYSQLYRFLRLVKNFFLPNSWRIIQESKFSKKIIDILKKEKDSENKNIDIDYLRRMIDSEFKSTVLSFIKVSRSFKIEPILMTQFNRVNKDDAFFIQTLEHFKVKPIKDYINIYNYLNNTIREIAKEENVLLIDLEKKINQDSKYIYDIFHPSDEGNKLIASIIANTLSKNFPEYFKLVELK